MKWLLQHGYYEKALAAVEEGNAKPELLEEVLQVFNCLSMLIREITFNVACNCNMILSFSLRGFHVANF